MALGASPARILKMVIGSGLQLTIVGAVIGFALSFGVTRLMRAMLYGVAPVDLVTLMSVALGIGIVSLVSTFTPALRAARVDPSITIRVE